MSAAVARHYYTTNLPPFGEHPTWDELSSGDRWRLTDLCAKVLAAAREVEEEQ